MPQSAVRKLLARQETEGGPLEALQPYHVRDILLVASLYDSYILSEGEHLSELLVGEYQALGLAAPPRVTRVTRRAEALERLAERPYDLVISLADVADLPAASFGREVKARRPGLPVVLLGFNMGELAGFAPTAPEAGIDRAFLWRGDMRLFLAVIKLQEDALNADHDTRAGGVRALLLIEDSVAFYSAYLPLLFGELVKQTAGLIAEGVTLSQRLLRMRLRPKVLLASTYEAGWDLYERHREALLGVFSDIEFPRGGQLDPTAGLKLLTAIRQQDAETPLLLQSSQERFEPEAWRLGAGFVRKGSPTLLHDLGAFMLQNLGFGDFVFRLADGSEVGRAKDLAEMIQVLPRVPAAALQFHGSHNHFSNWLMARTEFDLAMTLRRLRVTDFPTLDAMRDFLVETMVSLRERGRRGQVAQFDRHRHDPASAFARIGGGSLGGKGRGLAFLHRLLAGGELATAFPGLRLGLPRSAVLGTDAFERFLDANGLLPFALAAEDDRAIVERFQAAELPDDVVADLGTYLVHANYPLAVRSSSLLEDSHHQPAAGIYVTHMLPNSAPDAGRRLFELQAAIKHIYASVFFGAAKAYLGVTNNRVEEEKMAVVLQQVVGRTHGQVMYPDLAGVAASHNFYPVQPMRPEEGVARVALGFGKTVVEGGQALVFSPARPGILPQFGNPKAALANSQRSFWALDLARPFDPRAADAGGNLVRLDLAAAEAHGTLQSLASVYSPDDDAIYDGLSRPGVRLLTLAPILKHKLLPLPEVLRLFLELGVAALSGPVEIEFAANLAGGEGGPAEVALLQIRPLALYEPGATVDLSGLVPEEAFVRGARALGSGRSGDIRDIVAVRRDSFDRGQTLAVAEEVGRVNARLAAEGRAYLLVGPGRWGTADRWLGVPVGWKQISSARAILETELADLPVEPSQGTHFFHNMTSLGISYFTAHAASGAVVDWAWLEARTPFDEGRWVRHYRLAEPLEVLVDVRSGEGAILKRAARPAEQPTRS